MTMFLNEEDDDGGGEEQKENLGRLKFHHLEKMMVSVNERMMLCVTGRNMDGWVATMVNVVGCLSHDTILPN